MIIDLLTPHSRKEFTQKGEEGLHIYYKGHFSLESSSFRIYRMNGKYAICSEQLGAYGPVENLSEALQWEGFRYMIENFELSSQVLNKDSLKSLEEVFLTRMNELALRRPEMLSKLDEVSFWEAIELHSKNDRGINCRELKAYLTPRSVYGEIFLDKIILLTVEKKYSNILFKYGIDTIQLLVRYFEKQETYHVCQEIHDMVMDHNKRTNNNLNSTIG
jgi:hypothetical protein